MVADEIAGSLEEEEKMEVVSTVGQQDLKKPRNDGTAEKTNDPREVSSTEEMGQDGGVEKTCGPVWDGSGFALSDDLATRMKEDFTVATA
mmetsp:Transcript_7485/g.18157  ORF Transcript_7485/g.18157 Transcript_7485/m.18157 type:complete len:90 (+) Transcript_7485:2221-2490(+)